MKHLKLNKIAKTIKKFAPIILIVLLAAVARFYLFEKRVPFDADQEEIAMKAKELLSGNPVLLGPKTSLGAFSIGPGFTYIWAIFAFFLKNDPISGAYASVILGLIFIVGVYFTSRKIYSENVGIALSFLVAISFTLIRWDQSPWAPSLFYFSELLMFYGTYISTKNKWGLPIMALGLGLGFQAHFSIFLLILPTVIYLLIQKPVASMRKATLSLFILLSSTLPVILFDVTHGFINTRRLFSIFQLGLGGEGVSKLKIIGALATNSSEILWLEFTPLIKYVLFAIVVIYSFFKIRNDEKYKSLLLLANLYLFIPFLTFLTYQSNFSEYYLMSAVVPFIFLIGYIFESIGNKNVILAILLFLSLLNIKTLIPSKKMMNLAAKKEIVKEIVEKGGKSGYGVSLSVKLGYGFGYPYLFSYYGATPDLPPLKDQKKIFTIVSPPGFDGIEPVKQIDGVGLLWEGIE